MMAAGFSRSREFLADRMAVSLYGRDVFESALTTVATEGTLAEGGIFQNVFDRLKVNQAFENIYDAYRQAGDDDASRERRSKLHEELLAQPGTLFASHPTLTERFQAVAAFPPAKRRDATPARELLTDPAAVEKELTAFVTAFFQHIQQLQAAAATG
jgi:Zn-dependent protease with chaperone function